MSLDDLLAANGGAAARAELLTCLRRATLDDLIRRGELVAVFPRVYARPWDADLPRVRLRAALASVGGEVALSHTTALRQWQLLPPTHGPLHVTAYNPRHPRGVPGELVVHRTLLPLDAAVQDGLAVVRPELAAVTSWPLLDAAERRAPVILGAQRRLFDPGRLLDLAHRMWWIPGLPDLRTLVGMLAAGCESELELWGYGEVFDVPGLDDAQRQVVVRVGSETYRLDLAYVGERLAVELDGRKYHASPEQWERDIRRDLALATIGWQTIRFSHERLHYDIDGCRRSTLAVRAARRRPAA